MPGYRKAKKILMLQNEIEAQLFGAVLAEEDIPHCIVSYHDTAYDGLFQSQMGWGHLEADSRDADRIKELYDSFKKSED